MAMGLEKTFTSRVTNNNMSRHREFDPQTKTVINLLYMDNGFLPPHKPTSDMMVRIDELLENPNSIELDNVKHLEADAMVQYSAMRKFKFLRGEKLVPFNSEKSAAVNAIARDIFSKIAEDDSPKKKKKRSNNKKAAVKSPLLPAKEEFEIENHDDNQGDGGDEFKNTAGAVVIEKLDDFLYAYDSNMADCTVQDVLPKINSKLKNFVFQNDPSFSSTLETLQSVLFERSGDSRDEWMSGLKTGYDSRCPMCTEPFNVTTKVPMRSSCGLRGGDCVMCSLCWVEANVSVKRCLCARDFTAKSWVVDGAWIGARMLLASSFSYDENDGQ